MAFLEPNRTALGAFARTDLLARARFEAGAPPSDPQYWYGLGFYDSGWTTHASFNVPERGAGGDWTFAGSRWGWRTSFDSAGLADIYHVQWFDVVSQTPSSDVYGSTFPAALEVWDVDTPSQQPSWSRASPASTDPALTGDLGAWVTYMSQDQASIWPDGHIYTLNVPQLLVDNVGSGTFNNPTNIELRTHMWLVQAQTTTAVAIVPIPNQTNAATDPGVDLYPNCNADADAPHYVIASDGGFVAAGGSLSLTLSTAGDGAPYLWTLGADFSGMTPGAYVITIEGFNAWQGTPSSATFTWTVT